MVVRSKLVNQKKLNRRERWKQMKSEWDAVDARRGKRPADSVLKVGKRGNRAGWARSVHLEAGITRGLTPEDRAWREKVLHRDGYKCVCCGATDSLEADHIQPVSLYPDLRFNLENGQTLCHMHHVATETYGGKVRRIIAVSVEK